MKPTLRSKQGICVMIQLALNHGQGLMQIKTIAERVGISGKYFEQLIAMLKAAGLVHSIRGRNGGYFLSRQPSEIKVSQIIASLEGPTDDKDCRQHKKFTKGCGGCVMAKMWAKLEKNAWDYLESTTLQDLVDMKK